MNNESIEKYREWVATNFNSEIPEQLFDIYKEAMHDAKDDPSDQNGAGRISKTVAKACTLMARLSADQARAARKLEGLTYVIIFLTAILAFDVAYRVCHHADGTPQSAEQHKAGNNTNQTSTKTP